MKTLPEEIIQEVREGVCRDRCNESCVCEFEDDCTWFANMAQELQDQESNRDYFDMQETQRRLTRDMKADWRRENP